MSLELPVTPLPADSVMVRAVVIVEVLDADGDLALCVRKTDDTTRWQAAGLALAAADRFRAEVSANWIEEDDELPEEDP